MFEMLNAGGMNVSIRIEGGHECLKMKCRPGVQYVGTGVPARTGPLCWSHLPLIILIVPVRSALFSVSLRDPEETHAGPGMGC